MTDAGAREPAAGEDGRVERGFVITGRVQGVGFRWWTRECARELGLVGTVRNRPDGSVGICARGSGPSVAAFESRLWSGPVMARVDGVAHVACELSEGSTDFTIEH